MAASEGTRTRTRLPDGAPPGRSDRPAPLRRAVLAAALAGLLAAQALGACPDPAPVNLGHGTLQMPRAPQPAYAWTGSRRFDHVLFVLLENQDYRDVAAHPAMQALARQGTVLSQYRGAFHPSYPNYLALVGGRYFDTHGDRQTDIAADVPTIADLLEARGLGWRQYAEGYPGGCFLGDDAPGKYARKHVPFLSFRSVTANPRRPMRCAHVVPASAFDPQRLPEFAFYTPDLCHDGHDACTPGLSSLDQALQWLDAFLQPMLRSPQVMAHTLVVVAFDESRDYAHDHTYALLLGGMVRAGREDDGCYDPYNLLRTVELNFGLGDLGGEDAHSAPVAGAWRPAGP